VALHRRTLLPRLQQVSWLIVQEVDPKKYFVRTFGCQMNEHDSERIAGLLESEGMEAASSQEEADVVVLNTCCIRENADNRLYGTLGHLKSLKDAKPGLQIAVGGCLAQKDKGIVQQRAPWVDAVFGTHNVANAADLLRQAGANGPVMEILEESEAFPSALPARRDVPWAAWLTIQIGCDNNCAFCIVPSVRGKEISRPFGELLEEATQLAASGVTEITLLGQNVNSYGRDLTVALRARQERNVYQAGAEWSAAESLRPRPLFADLLKAVGAIDGIERVRYTSPHPKDLRPETIAAMAETPTVCNHLHLPLQSGSDRVLAAMHRGYSAERYLEKLSAARAGVDDLAVTTDIIVGFPGETDEEFEQTCAVAAEAEYDSAYVFQFSPREGTEAAQLSDQFISAEKIGERFATLQQIVERSSLQKHQARVGRTEELLVEGPSKRDATVTSGRTTQNKLVHFPGVVGAGSRVLVEITGAAPHFLRGELKEVVAAPRHKRRIPVTSL
jgi:tRNA-2-methylthio-N6-dimethylallyladenosine synthase